ncbi:hypothetical protein GMMP15_1310012 [Candidatus Magnetomoraceae bacterium gMMP-15]
MPKLINTRRVYHEEYTIKIQSWKRWYFKTEYTIEHSSTGIGSIGDSAGDY